MIRQQWQAFLLAVSFLTKIPVDSITRKSPDSFQQSVGYFSVVGAMVGAIGALTFVLIHYFIHSPALSVLGSMLATVWVTGSFHEDGLADTADGLWGGHDRERRLEIMKDSRIGTHGSLALWFGMTAKFILLLELSKAGIWILVTTLISAHAMGRGGSLLLMIVQSYARREDSSKSVPFVNNPSKLACLVGFLFAATLAILLNHRQGMVGIAAVVLITLLCGRYYHRKIGGVTGDCLGATCQIAEVCYYLAAILLINN